MTNAIIYPKSFNGQQFWQNLDEFKMNPKLQERLEKNQDNAGYQYDMGRIFPFQYVPKSKRYEDRQSAIKLKD